MPKRLKIKLQSRLTYEKFYAAFLRASKSRSHHPAIVKFKRNLTSNLGYIMDVVGQGEYKVSPYNVFEIYDPKQRIIKSLPIEDRILHQWLVEEFIKPYYVPRFIDDTYACLEHRGNHAAAYRIQAYMRKMYASYGKYYILKMDISKFFYRIDKDILFGIIKKSVADPALLQLIYNVIYDDETEKVGIPIGNYTSQYFANIYLNELDQYCKRVLKIKYYVRYMDDFIALAPNRQTAKLWYDAMQKFVETKLNLTLNPKSKYFPSGHALEFVGYKIFETRMLLRKRSKRKFNDLMKAYASGLINYAELEQKFTAWYGQAGHANSSGYVKKGLAKNQLMLDLFDKLSSKRSHL